MSQRTLLLFVIRDHIGTTPLANLAKTLTDDITKIWESLSKPEGLQDRKLADYFDLSFTALPHKILAADNFEAEVGELRKRFVDKTRDDYVFVPANHKRIPADGVAVYMERIWVRSLFRFLSVIRMIRVCLLLGTSPEQQGSRSPNSARIVGAIPLRRDFSRRTVKFHRISQVAKETY